MYVGQITAAKCWLDLFNSAVTLLPLLLSAFKAVVFHSRFQTLRPSVRLLVARPSPTRGILINGAVDRQLRSYIIAVPSSIICSQSSVVI